MTATAKAGRPSTSAGSGDEHVLRRLARVARQLVVAAVSAVAYYAATRWLLDRFGTSGFLYALLVLAAVMALLREFGSDLRELPTRIRAWAARRRAAPVTAGAEDEAAAAPAPARPVPTTRAEAEAMYREQERALDPASFEAFATGFQLIDQHGKYWTIRRETGAWAFFKGGQWHEGMPLGTLSPRSSS